METLIQIIFPSVVLPLILSALLWWFSRNKPEILWSLPLFWLPSYLWLIGWPPLPPAEASHWLWLLVVASVIIAHLFKSRSIILITLQTTLLVLMLLLVARPVLQYQFEITLLFELFMVLLGGLSIIIFMPKNQNSTPALSMSISSGGMAMVVALGGSLLIGQLAGALASLLAIFALTEVIRKLRIPAMSYFTVIPVLELYLLILVIARIYVEIPVGPSILLLAAPLVGLVPKTRFAFIFSTASIIAALSWLLFTAESSAYY